MKKIFLTVLFTLSLFGAEVSTKEDIKEMRDELRELILGVKADMQREMDKRFEGVDKRFESIDKRFEGINKQFESTNKRIDDVNTYLVTMIIGIFSMIGFIWWDRRTMIDRAKVEVKQEVTAEFSEIIAKKADKNVVDKILDIFENLAKNDKEIEEVLRKHNFRPA